MVNKTYDDLSEIDRLKLKNIELSQQLSRACESRNQAITEVKALRFKRRFIEARNKRLIRTVNLLS